MPNRWSRSDLGFVRGDYNLVQDSFATGDELTFTGFLGSYFELGHVATELVEECHLPFNCRYRKKTYQKRLQGRSTIELGADVSRAWQRL